MFHGSKIIKVFPPFLSTLHTRDERVEISSRSINFHSPSGFFFYFIFGRIIYFVIVRISVAKISFSLLCSIYFNKCITFSKRSLAERNSFFTQKTNLFHVDIFFSYLFLRRDFVQKKNFSFILKEIYVSSNCKYTISILIGILRNSITF